MIISSLKIYGFGKICDMQIDLLSGINVIEGKNEVGKTTLKAFIKAMFFGFESRRNMHNRYEPIHGGKFGGVLHLVDEKGEKYIIERVYNQKMGGDVKITIPNGEIKGEEYLQYLIGKINENVYKQIFCFGLTELQKIDSLNNSEINDFIYHVGTGSVNQILTMKQDLDNKTQKLYKSGGKNPKINILLKEIDSVSEEIESLKQNNMNYDIYNKKISILDEEISNIEEEVDSLKKELNLYETLNRVNGINIQVELIDKKLLEYPKDFNFPENGEERLSTQISNIAQIEIDNKQLNEKKKEIDDLIENIIIDPFYNNNEEEINYFNNQLNSYLKNITKKQHLDNEYSILERSVESNLKQTGTSFSEVDIRQFECSIQDKQYINELSDNIKKKEYEISEINREIDIKKSTKDQIERKIELLDFERKNEISLGPNKDTYLLINNYWKGLKNNEWKIEQYQEQIKDYSEQIKSVEKEKSFSISYLLLNIFIAASILILFFIDPIYAVILLGIDFLFNLLFQLNKKSIKKRFRQANKSKIANIKFKISELEFEINKTRNKALTLLNQLGFHEFNELTIQKTEDLIDEKLLLEQTYSERKNRLIELHSDLDLCIAGLKQFINRTEKLQIELNDYIFNWKEWLKIHRVDSNISINIAFDLFTILEKLKETYSRKDSVKSDIEINNRSIDEYESSFKLLINDIEMSGNIEEKVLHLVKNLRKVEKDRLKKEHLISIKEDISDRLYTINKRLDYEQNKYNDLLKYAEVNNDEEFYKLEKKYYEYKELINERLQLLNTISSVSSDENNIEELNKDLKIYEKRDIDLIIKKLTDDLKEKTEQIKAFSEEKGQLQNKVKEMEEDLTLSTLNQKHAELSSELNSCVKEWSALTLSKYILAKTMELYEMEKQPAVLKKASDYFSKMTGNKYNKIISSISTNEIKVISDNGLVLEPKYLSRGTVEQLFLSMRFALVEEYSKQMLLPIVLDDIFVNFDNDRLINSLYAIINLAEKHQIILFTCHNNISKQVREKINEVNYLVLL